MGCCPSHKLDKEQKSLPPLNYDYIPPKQTCLFCEFCKRMDFDPKAYVWKTVSFQSNNQNSNNNEDFMYMPSSNNVSFKANDSQSEVDFISFTNYKDDKQSNNSSYCKFHRYMISNQSQVSHSKQSSLNMFFSSDHMQKQSLGQSIPRKNLCDEESDEMLFKPTNFGTNLGTIVENFSENSKDNDIISSYENLQKKELQQNRQIIEKQTQKQLLNVQKQNDKNKQQVSNGKIHSAIYINPKQLPQLGQNEEPLLNEQQNQFNKQIQKEEFSKNFESEYNVENQQSKSYPQLVPDHWQTTGKSVENEQSQINNQFNNQSKNIQNSIDHLQENHKRKPANLPSNILNQVQFQEEHRVNQTVGSASQQQFDDKKQIIERNQLDGKQQETKNLSKKLNILITQNQNSQIHDNEDNNDSKKNQIRKIDPDQNVTFDIKQQKNVLSDFQKQNPSDIFQPLNEKQLTKVQFLQSQNLNKIKTEQPNSQQTKLAIINKNDEITQRKEEEQQIQNPKKMVAEGIQTSINDCKEIPNVTVKLKPYKLRVLKMLKSSQPYERQPLFERNDLPQQVIADGLLTYFGTVENGKKCGFGIAVFRDSAYYEGYWKDNKAHYHGRLFHADGDIYEGQWENGIAQGQGVYYSNGKEKYRGIFKNDHPELIQY